MIKFPTSVTSFLVHSNFKTSARTFQLRRNFSTSAKFSNFKSSFPTSLGSFQLQSVFTNLSETFQLQTFQLLVLSNCPCQLHVSHSMLYFKSTHSLTKIKDRIYSVFMMTHIIIQGPYILRPRDRIFYALKTVFLKSIFFLWPYIFR